MGGVDHDPGAALPALLHPAWQAGRRDRPTSGAQGWPVGGKLLDPATVEAARLPGRLEKHRVGRVPVVIDGAHVASSVRMALEELAADPELAGPAVVVLALGRDKDARKILKVLADRTDSLICTTVPSGPLSAAEVLAEEAQRAGLGAETAADPLAAYARALELAEDGRWVLVIGSFYLAGAIRESLVESPQPPA